MLSILETLIWFLISLGTGYLWLIALASLRKHHLPNLTAHLHRFAIALPAHDEQEVIGQTVATLMQLDYPCDQFDVFVVADNCADQTAEFARGQGAICFERQTTEWSSKGAALSWLFERIFAYRDYDAVVIFDADTQVEASFLRVMSARLAAGKQVIQGKHVISNPRQGWFPALTWAMMAIDCRFFSQGRANLGLSARHMGDSICFRSQVLKDLGWSNGLTEDYELRLRLLLDGICIDYEPRALGYGQAPVTWHDAQTQRLRWARGVADAGKAYRRELLVQGLKRTDWRLLDGAISISLPSYSALTLFSILMLALNLALSAFNAPVQIWGWLIVLLLLFLYPLFGLLLERAPGWAYFAILSGPLYMVWRMWINLMARLRARQIVWVRTPHRGRNSD